MTIPGKIKLVAALWAHGFGLALNPLSLMTSGVDQPKTCNHLSSHLWIQIAYLSFSLCFTPTREP